MSETRLDPRNVKTVTLSDILHRLMGSGPPEPKDPRRNKKYRPELLCGRCGWRSIRSKTGATADNPWPATTYHHCSHCGKDFIHYTKRVVHPVMKTDEGRDILLIHPYKNSFGVGWAGGRVDRTGNTRKKKQLARPVKKSGETCVLRKYDLNYTDAIHYARALSDFFPGETEILFIPDAQLLQGGFSPEYLMDHGARMNKSLTGKKDPDEDDVEEPEEEDSVEELISCLRPSEPEFSTFAQKREYYANGDVTVSLSLDEPPTLEEELEEFLGKVFADVEMREDGSFECDTGDGLLVLDVDENGWTMQLGAECDLSVSRVRTVSNRLSRYFDVSIEVELVNSVQ